MRRHDQSRVVKDCADKGGVSRGQVGQTRSHEVLGCQSVVLQTRNDVSVTGKDPGAQDFAAVWVIYQEASIARVRISESLGRDREVWITHRVGLWWLAIRCINVCR